MGGRARLRGVRRAGRRTSHEEGNQFPGHAPLRLLSVVKVLLAGFLVILIGVA